MLLRQVIQSIHRSFEHIRTLWLGTGATTSHILRASASSSPPPVHTVEEEVGDDIQDEDDEDMDDSNGDLSRQTGASGNILPLLNMDKHRMSRKSKAMLALGGKKAGKGKGNSFIEFRSK